MAGALQMLVTRTPSPPASPMSVGASVWGGSVPVNVSTASGTSDSLPNGGFRYFQADASGGAPPYRFRWTRQNGVNKTVLLDPDSSLARVGWSDMVVGEYQSTTARCQVTDANGATATSSTIVIGFNRVA